MYKFYHKKNLQGYDVVNTVKSQPRNFLFFYDNVYIYIYNFSKLRRIGCKFVCSDMHKSEFEIPKYLLTFVC